MTIPLTTVRVQLVGATAQLPTPIRYDLALDVLTPGDALTLEWPLTASTWNACAMDSKVRLFFDGVPVFTGYVDDRAEAQRGTFQVTALDTMGRGLVKESVDGAGFSLRGLTLEQAALRCAGPWFDRVVFNNAEDRTLRRGRGRKVASAPPPVDARTARVLPSRIGAGTTRFGALESILEPLGLLAWSNATGTDLIITTPQYRQEAQYAFHDDIAGSRVIQMQYRTSNAGRYALVEVSGSGRATGSEAATIAASEKASEFAQRHRIGVARDATGDFQHPARLFLAEQVRDAAEATALARRVMRESLTESRQVTVAVPGHGQGPEGGLATLYTVDTVASVTKRIRRAPDDDSPVTILEEDMYVSAVRFSGSRSEGQRTSLTMTPLEVELT